MRLAALALLLALTTVAVGQGTNSIFPAQSFTASAQTGTTIQLNRSSSTSTVGSNFSVGTVTLTGTGLTTVTFAVMGSSDNGVTFFALPISAVASPGSTPSTTVTATAAGLYQVNLVGITHVYFVTSGTFTATSISLLFTASPNGSISKVTSGGGSPTGAAGGSLSGSYPNPGLSSSAVASAVAGQNITPKITNGISKCETYAGSDVAVKVNACIADAIAQTNGNGTAIADATNLGGNLTYTSGPIIYGNSSGASVLLILPCYGSWQANFTNTSSTNGYALMGYGGAVPVGVCPVSDTFYIGNTPTSSLYAIWGVFGATGSSYTHAEGFSVINSSGNPTASGYSVLINGNSPSEAFCDGSKFDNVNVSDGANGGSSGVGAVQIQNVGCGFTWSNSFLSGSGVGTPVTILASNGNIVQGLNFISDTFVAPGGSSSSGGNKPVFYCQDTSTTPTTVINVWGGYTETATSGTTSNEAYIDGCRKVGFQGHTFSSNLANNTSTLFTTTNRFNTDLEIDGISAISGLGNWVYPVKAVVNGFTGETIYTDANGFRAHYSPSTVPSSFGPVTAPAFNPRSVYASPYTTWFNDFYTPADVGTGGVGVSVAQSCVMSATYQDQNHPGNLLLTSGTGGTGTGVYCGTASSTIASQLVTLSSSLPWILEGMVYVPVLPGTTVGAYQFGTAHTVNASPWTTGIGFYLSSANGAQNDWYCEYNSTYTDTTVAATVAWTRLSLVSDGTLVHWYVNGTQVCGTGVAVGSVPTSTQYAGVFTAVGLSANSISLGVDYVDWQRSVTR